jgi:LysR family glycine cleavage system transcriptional activator
MTHLPSMKALRALEAVGRLGSVRQAAEELSLTRSAVSHQLRFLEEDLGFALTERVGRGIVLTLRGERYAREVRGALRALARAQAHTAETELVGRLTISCTPGFATYWLCPNVARFVGDLPNIDLSIVSPRRLDDVTAPGVDIFIAYGQGDWPDMWVEPMAELEFSPVCSPTLLQQGLREPRDLVRFRLLHLSDQSDWVRWLAAVRVAEVDARRGIAFSDMNLALSAAMAGQGVAMGDSLIFSNALASGTLVQPFSETIPAPAAYYIVADPAAVENPLVQAFLGWLRGQLSAMDISPQRGLSR